MKKNLEKARAACETLPAKLREELENEVEDD